MQTSGEAAANVTGTALVRAGAPAQQPNGESKTRCRFRKKGEIWDLEFDGEAGQYRDRVGLNYIAQMLGQAHKSVDAVDLCASQGRGRRRGTSGMRRVEPLSGYERST
jgi:hypothetical protein